MDPIGKSNLGLHLTFSCPEIRLMLLSVPTPYYPSSPASSQDTSRILPGLALLMTRLTLFFFFLAQVSLSHSFVISTFVCFLMPLNREVQFSQHEIGKPYIDIAA